MAVQVHRMLTSTPHQASLAVMGLQRFQSLHYRRFITHQVVMVITLVVALLTTCSVRAQDDFCITNLATLGQYPDVVMMPDSSSAAASRDSGLLAGCTSDTAYLECNGTQVLPFTATDRPQKAKVMCDGTTYTWVRVMSDGSHVDLTNSPACVQRCSDMCEHFVADNDLYKTTTATNVTMQAQNSGVLFRGCDYEVFVLKCVDAAATIHINYTQQPENVVHNNLDLGSDTLTATCTTGASSTEKLYTTDSAAYKKIPANTNTAYSCFAPMTSTTTPTTTTEVTTTTPITTTPTTTTPPTTTTATTVATTTVPATTATTSATTTAAGATTATSPATTTASGATTTAQGATTTGTAASTTTKVATMIVTNPDGSSVTLAGGSAVTIANGTYVVTNPGGSVVTNSAGAVVTYSSNSVVVTNADGSVVTNADGSVVTNADGSVVTNADGSAVTGTGTTTTAPGSGGSTAAAGLGGSKSKHGRSFFEL